MNNKNSVEERWKNLNNKSKKWHQFIGASLFKTLPIMLVLVVVFGIDGRTQICGFKCIFSNCYD